MVLLGGPRQVGKTSLALRLLSRSRLPARNNHPAYFNWDVADRQALIRSGLMPTKETLLVFDEIHKYRKWRNFLKGLFDSRASQQSILVTGSARLDHYRRGGDSLLGRYFYYRLHPLSLRELNSHPSKKDLEELLTFGGFPEPLFSGRQDFVRRWQNERRKAVIFEDVRDLERVRELGLIDLLIEELPKKVGSPLSIQALREDLEGSSHEAVRSWIEILENLYYCFRLAPFYPGPRIRAVKKEQKLYLWDWSEIEADGPRFENLVASQLLKYCHWIEDTQGERMELRFLRDHQKREIDFVVLKNRKPLFAVECKSGEREPSSALVFFQERVKIPSIYQVHRGERDLTDAKTGIRVLPFRVFCTELEMP